MAMKLTSLLFVCLIAGCGSETSTTIDAGEDTATEPVDTGEAPVVEDTSGPPATFNDVYTKVLKLKCSGGYCHGGGLGGWSVTASESTTYAELVGPTSSRCTGLKKVEPGAPEKSSLYLKIRGGFDGVCTGNKMPPSGTSVSATQLEMVRSWIAAGAKP